MKLIISTIVAGIVLFILGWVFYGMLFMDYFSTHYAKMQRSPEDMKMWAIALSCLLQGFFLSFIYPRMYKSGSPVGNGLKYGIIIGLFMSLPYMFSSWATMPITYRVVIVDAAILFVMIFIACIAVALVYGRREPEKIVLKESPGVTAKATT
ncbi:MAG: hypothetical protein EHM58_08620 [Ignavibacteriae bacterium]|nr:MAG: hypothetical protein EHM58_08620 [Ignavibacteriota bacterium]